MPSTSLTTPWVIVPVPKPGAHIRLFCFPYAGGGASVFWAWPRLLPSSMEVCAVQLPGREGRLREPPLTRWEDAVERLAVALAPWMHRSFAFFGHSLGAVLAFELARRLARDRRPGPVHLFASGRVAPQVPPDDPTHDLPEEEFVCELRRLTGTPDDVLASPELRNLFVPLLRADFGMNETYVYQPGPPLDVPISAYGGVDDEDVSPEDLEQWRAHTTRAFRRVMFPGGHFFVRDECRAVLSELTRELHRGIARADGRQ